MTLAITATLDQLRDHQAKLAAAIAAWKLWGITWLRGGKVRFIGYSREIEL